MDGLKTAAILIIGDEILSGRTKDKNINTLALWLGTLAIYVREARIVGDRAEAIVAAVNALRAAHDYVFTSGGIGPTHDDITADSIAAAFGRPIGYHPDAYALLEAHYAPDQFNEARKRMARIPDGASLIANPVSRAPGFRIENVFVLPGVPMILEAMLPGLEPELAGGPRVHVRTVTAPVMEGEIAETLRTIAERRPTISLGSYPFFRQGLFGVSVVAKGTDDGEVGAAIADLLAFYAGRGVAPFPD